MSQKKIMTGKIAKIPATNHFEIFFLIIFVFCLCQNVYLFTTKSQIISLVKMSWNLIEIYYISYAVVLFGSVAQLVRAIGS